MFGKKSDDTITAPEVLQAITELKQLARDIEGDTRNVLEVCKKARGVDAKILSVNQQMAHAHDTTQMLKLSENLKALVEQRQKFDEKIDSISDTGGLLARKINHLADSTLIRLGAALRRIAALSEIENEK